MVLFLVEKGDTNIIESGCLRGLLMANANQREIIKQGSTQWNAWREKNPTAKIDFSGADLRGTYLHKINLHEATLRNANFEGVKLSSADLSHADLRGAKLNHADLSWSDFSEAVLIRAQLKGANLGQAKLPHARLQEADLSDAILVGADLSAADLTKAKLVNSSLVEADLSWANLTNVDLSGTDLTQAKLKHVNLNGSSFSSRTAWPQNFDPFKHGAHKAARFQKSANHGDFSITFDREVSPDQVKRTLTALGDFFRACGGIGFEIDTELQVLVVEEPTHV